MAQVAPVKARSMVQLYVLVHAVFFSKTTFSNVVVNGKPSTLPPLVVIYNSSGIVSNNGVWYGAGTFSLTSYEGWMGSVTYSGPNTNPNFTLRNSDAGESHSGQLTPTASTGLTEIPLEAVSGLMVRDPLLRRSN